MAVAPGGSDVGCDGKGDERGDHTHGEDGEGVTHGAPTIIGDHLTEREKQEQI